MRITSRHIPFFSIYFLIRTAAKNGGISFGRVPVFAAYMVRYLMLEPFRLLELLIFDRKIRSHQMTHDPIFVLGHWRSGTTHLQSLLCKDPRHVSTTIFNFLFSDNYYLTEPWLKKPLNGICRIFKVQYTLQRLPMNLDHHAELDSAMCANCYGTAYTWGHLFPERFESWIDHHLIVQDEKCSKEWIRDYDYLIRKLSFRNKNKQVVIKSPGDTARVELLLQKYPNAKFIYIHRDPVEVFHSNKYLWGVILKQNAFQKLSDVQVETYILDTYKKILKKYLASRDSIPTAQLAELHFDQVQKNPLGILEEVYERLGLGHFPAEELASYIHKNRTYRVNQYAVSPQLQERISTEWEFSYKAWPKR
jgi:omega-hydroxy-beta-dihydromenaquinone-9 sulfotransferase